MKSSVYVFAVMITSLSFLSSSVFAENSDEHARIAKNDSNNMQHPKTQADYEREAQKSRDNTSSEYSDEELVRESNSSNNDFGSYSYGSTSFGFQPK
jgi:hypothetical protein